MLDHKARDWKGIKHNNFSWILDVKLNMAVVSMPWNSVVCKVKPIRKKQCNRQKNVYNLLFRKTKRGSQAADVRIYDENRNTYSRDCSRIRRKASPPRSIISHFIRMIFRSFCACCCRCCCRVHCEAMRPSISYIHLHFDFQKFVHIFRLLFPYSNRSLCLFIQFDVNTRGIHSHIHTITYTHNT